MQDPLGLHERFVIPAAMHENAAEQQAGRHEIRTRLDQGVEQCLGLRPIFCAERRQTPIVLACGRFERHRRRNRRRVCAWRRQRAPPGRFDARGSLSVTEGSLVLNQREAFVHLPDRLGMAEQQEPSVSQRVVKLAHQPARHLRPEINRHVLAEHDVLTRGRRSRHRHVCQVRILKANRTLDLIVQTEALARPAGSTGAAGRPPRCAAHGPNTPPASRSRAPRC